MMGESRRWIATSGPLGRRAFLGGLTGLAGMTVLASCGSSSASNVVESCVSKLSLPVKAPDKRSGMVVSNMANVPVAWNSYPTPYASTSGAPPGSGDTVTTFQILFGPPPPPLSSNPWLQEFNKKLNVNYQANLADSADYVDKLNTLAASGSFPDITYINFNQNGLYNGAGFQKFISEGAFHNLTSYLSGKGLKEFPNLQLLPELTWKGSSFEGGLYGVPYPIAPVNGQLIMYRKDWAQKLGVDNPKNADEVMKMFVAFSTQHPNGPGKESWGMVGLYQQIFYAMFGVPNNWRVNKDGSLTKDLETEEFKAALAYARTLWQKGAIYPGALTVTNTQAETLMEGGQVGAYTQGSVGWFGDQPGTVATLTKENNPGADPAPWLPPGENGGNPTMSLGSASYGFGAIPTAIKDEKKIVELLRIMDFMAAPFGSVEYNFMIDGIEGQMFNYVNGEPVSVTNGNQNWNSGLNYLCAPDEINYFFANQPGEAVLMQNLQGKQLQGAVSDPTLNLYSPTWVEDAANLIELQTDGYQGIVSGRQPLSSLSDLISNWKSQGGDQVRKEFEQSLKKCG